MIFFPFMKMKRKRMSRLKKISFHFLSLSLSLSLSRFIAPASMLPTSHGGGTVTRGESVPGRCNSFPI